MKSAALLKTILAVVICLSLLPLLRAEEAKRASDSKPAVEKLVKGWIGGAKNKDAAAAEAAFADDFSMTDSGGNIIGKSDVVDAIREGKLVIESADYDDVNVRVYGDAAVVTGKLAVKGTMDGNDLSGDYRFTDTVIKHDGKWQIVAAHYSGRK